MNVAVIGGSLAGAITTLNLLQKGVHPLWIAPLQEKNVAAGEHLSAAALPMLAALGLSLDEVPHLWREGQTTYSAWGSDLLLERHAMVHLEGPPKVLDRMGFNAWVQSAAVQEGGCLNHNSLEDFFIEDGKWVLRLSNGDIHLVDFIFDATGRRARIASKFATRYAADKLGCLLGFYRSNSAKDLHHTTLIEATEMGWWYLASLPDNKIVVQFYSDTDLSTVTADQFFYEAEKTTFLGAYLDDYGCTAVDMPTRFSANSTWLSPVIGPGWAAVGDASAAFDPLSSFGMTTAIWTAIQASNAFVAQDKAKIQAYANQVTQGVQNYLLGRADMYGRERRWLASEFWRRRHEANV